MPHFGLPFQPGLAERSQVESCPFSFEERERESKVLREKKLDQMRNEEVGFPQRSAPFLRDGAPSDAFGEMDALCLHCRPLLQYYCHLGRWLSVFI